MEASSVEAAYGCERLPHSVAELRLRKAAPHDGLDLLAQPVWGVDDYTLDIDRDSQLGLALMRVHPRQRHSIDAAASPFSSRAGCHATASYLAQINTTFWDMVVYRLVRGLWCPLEIERGDGLFDNKRRFLPNQSARRPNVMFVYAK